ncbi:proteoglycan 4a [Eucyclogobius newberryi]|uniref:proteoglycan 4a n=1 Tax=Eucyclogobius newberryi TaxID=166745 RepID=UPI003B5B7F11
MFPPPPRSAGKVDFHLVLSHAGVSVARQNPVLIAPPVLRPRPNPLHELAAALGLSLLHERGLVDDLCSDAPISGLTALSNGTIVIFKGELFWTVDPVSHHISHPNSISKTLGVPSHIDTVFTRSNCQANVYIFKGNLYWRLDRNLLLEPGFPKPLSHEFPGLTPGLTAALSAPATVSRAETVYFFRRGEIMQRFTFPTSNIPACGITPRGFVKTQVAEVLLSQEIHIKVSMKGFPVPITSALTAPIPMKAEIYEHYVFSGPLFFSVSVIEDLPALVGPDYPRPVVLSPPVIVENSVTNVVTVISDPPHPAENSLRVWLQCPA